MSEREIPKRIVNPRGAVRRTPLFSEDRRCASSEGPVRAEPRQAALAAAGAGARSVEESVWTRRVSPYDRLA